MQKLFIDFIPNDKIILNEEQSRHIAKSLRMQVGDTLMLTCGDGNDYGCLIEQIDNKQVLLSVCYKQANNSEPSVKVTLFQGVPKGDKMEDIIQKCTELGVSSIVPVLTKRAISRPDEKSAKKKRTRYQKIALEAAQQSGRGIIPEIGEMQTLKQAVQNDNSDIKILFYEGGGEPLTKLIDSNTKSVSIFIGPEGGFEADEVELIKEEGG